MVFIATIFEAVIESVGVSQEFCHTPLNLVIGRQTQEDQGFTVMIEDSLGYVKLCLQKRGLEMTTKESLDMNSEY